MSILEEVLFYQEIICKALSILELICEEPNEFVSKEELEMLPKVKEREFRKMELLGGKKLEYDN